MPIYDTSLQLLRPIRLEDLRHVGRQMNGVEATVTEFGCVGLGPILCTVDDEEPPEIELT